MKSESEKNMKVYFDNAASAITNPAAAKAVANIAGMFANPSSLHSAGMGAAALLKEARAEVAFALGCDIGELIFTSGGTESNNTAVFAHAQRNYRAGKRIITTGVEHPSVLEPINFLKSQGYEVDMVPVAGGVFDYGYFEESLKKGACLVAVMQANNQTGCMFELDKIRSVMDSCGSGAMLHCDAVQGFMKTLPEQKRALCRACDTVSISAHKIGGLKGCGALFIKKGTRFKPLLLGGEQERGFRGGTENLLGAVSFGAAAADTQSKHGEYASAVNSLRSLFLSGLEQLLGSAVSVFSPFLAIPHIVNISVKGVRSEVMLNYLSSKDIYISASSACSARIKENPTLEAFGLSRDYTYSALRIAFSPFNTAGEVEKLLEGLYTGSKF